MRYLQAFVFLAFLLAIGVFAIQNRDVITVNFLNWKLSQPVALLSVLVYALGMLSGWTVVAFLRRSIHGVTAKPQH
jgi:lipopolysaccharide assembly protein A